MKAKVTRPDGTVIELEGTAEEIRQATQAVPFQFIPSPFGVTPYVPYSPFWIEPWRTTPTWTLDVNTQPPVNGVWSSSELHLGVNNG